MEGFKCRHPDRSLYVGALTDMFSLLVLLSQESQSSASASAGSATAACIEEVSTPEVTTSCVFIRSVTPSVHLIQ